MHLIHDYYQVANGMFLIAGAALLTSGLIAADRGRLAAIAVVYIVAGSQAKFAVYDWPTTINLDRDPGYVAGQFVNATTNVRSSLIVFGIDWSPEIHYYAERKGVALPLWSTAAKTKLLLEEPERYLVKPSS